jgi:hypothetical protein
LKDYVRSVIPYPAFKLFLAYKTSYKTPGGAFLRFALRLGATFRICPSGRHTISRLFRSRFHPESESDLLKGPCLVMASYDDAGTVSYWKALEVPEDAKRAANGRIYGHQPYRIDLRCRWALNEIERSVPAHELRR